LGAEKSDGRWHAAARGKRIVRLSEHPAAALIEMLNQNILPPQWRDEIATTQTLADQWLQSSSSALMAVPGLPSPESLNHLSNPLHQDAVHVTVAWCRRLITSGACFVFGEPSRSTNGE
jgi:RES domain-containing protein